MKAAVFQSDGAGLTPAQRLDRLATTIDGVNCDLVICPELFMSGYNTGNKRSELAEALDGPFSRAVAKVARQNHTAIVYGYPECEGDRIFNSACCIGADGARLANHRKLAIPPGIEMGQFEPGSSLTFFAIGGIRFSILICYDAEFPEAVRAACRLGAQVVIVPTALSDQWDQVAHRVMPTRAFENGCYLLYANHSGTEGELNYLGCSCIIGPDGRDLARASADGELLTGHLLLEHVTAARIRLPYFRDLEDLEPRLASRLDQ